MGFAAHTIRDQIAYFNNASRLRKPAFNVIDRMQMHECTPGEQLLATAAALIAMCQTVNVNVGDVLAKASRALGDAEGPFTSHMQAVRDYAAGELAKSGE